MSAQREPIAVIGTGYVGLVTAAGFAELGSEVFCVDIDAAKIAALRAGEVPIYEPGLAELCHRHGARLHFSTDLARALAHARLLFVCVGTPPTYSGDADLSAVHAVVEAMPPSECHALVMKSTVPVGTGASIRRHLDQEGKGGFAYVSCPEFLKEGVAVRDFLRPDRVVVGDDGDWAGDAVAELYAPLGAPLVRTDVASAEMVKLASNAFLATKISFINEIANVCEATGADVDVVARGMGLDRRIGHHFLRRGVGYGGSCLAGDETVLVRIDGRTRLLRFDALWMLLSERLGSDGNLIEPDGMEALSWVPGEGAPRFLPVSAVTRRRFEGEIVELRTKMGRRLRCTPDHPFWVRDGAGGELRIKPAGGLTAEDWLPLAQGCDEEGDRGGVYPVLGAVEEAGLGAADVRVGAQRAADVAARPVDERRTIFAGASSLPGRSRDVRQSGTLRLNECALADLDVRATSLGTARNGAFVASEIAIDEAFWRVVGLYLAEGNCTFDERNAFRTMWSFHREREQHLVDEVVTFWRRHGVHARARKTPTSHCVTVQSRLVGAWWTGVFGLGRTSYQQRLPDLIWERCDEEKWALLSGLFEGDGSWSLINGGPSVIIELGTVSDELADGVLRLLSDLGIVASRRIGRVAKSTKDTHWIRISGAEQVERAIALVPVRDRPGVRASLARQHKRIAPTGYRRFDDGPVWVRVTSAEHERFAGEVYSLEVPYAHTVVTSACSITHNCFPKDVSALKQLAGNSGYHFQLLTSVIEVNELQKRRVIAKLRKHLESLVGRRVALLGLAFKADTDDMREASSLVLASRLLADGAAVSAYDPVAEEAARPLLRGVALSDSALDALDGADACVLVTEWPEFSDLDWNEVARRMTGRVVIDGRNFLDAERVAAAGFAYEGIGR